METNRLKSLSRAWGKAHSVWGIRLALCPLLYALILFFFSWMGLAYGEENQKDIDILREEVKEIREGFNKNSKIFHEKINEIKRQIGAIEQALNNTRDKNEQSINSINGEIKRIREDLDLIRQTFVQNRNEDKADVKQSLEALKEEIRKDIDRATTPEFIRMNQSLEGLKKELEKNRNDTDSSITSLNQNLATLNENTKKHFEERDRQIKESFNALKEDINEKDKKITSIITKMEEQAKERKAEIASLEERIIKVFEERNKLVSSDLATILKALEEKGREIETLKTSLKEVSEASMSRDRELAESLKKIIADSAKEREVLQSTILKVIEEGNKQTLVTFSEIAKDLENKAKKIALLERSLEETANRLKTSNERLIALKQVQDKLLEDMGGQTTSSIFSVFFDSGSLNPITEEPLGSIVRILKKDNTLLVRLSGWSDMHGDPASSIEVASKRAMAVRNYLISRGIDKKRILSIQAGRDLNPDTKQARRVDVFVYKPGTSVEEVVSHKPQEIIPPEEVLYAEAKDALDKNEYPKALSAFSNFLKHYPDNNLSDNAQYWIGEIYYVQHDYKRALEEFEKVIDRYPNGDKVPSALLKKALTLYYLGDKTKAKGLLEEVRKRYEGTEVSVVAGEKLKELFGG